MDDKSAKALRAPFDPKVLGILPKPFKKDSPKGKCSECGGYHGLPAVHLDFAGHAAVTDRLLSVDPEWTWEPLALTEAGLPAYDDVGGLWIKLTVKGVTRLGYGDGSTSSKELIGDALRNAAMRFGVALDLWSKDELESTLADPALKNKKPTDKVKSVMGGGKELTPIELAKDELAGLLKVKFSPNQIRAAMDKLTTLDEVNAAIKKVHLSQAEAN